MSSPPSFCRASSMRAGILFASIRFAEYPVMPFTDEKCCSTPLLRVSTASTFAPCLTKVRATASPMPLPAFNTSAFSPYRRKGSPISNPRYVVSIRRAWELVRKRIVGELFAQFNLLDLAGRGVWQFINKLHIVWTPPTSDLAFIISQQLISCSVRSCGANDDQ